MRNLTILSAILMLCCASVVSGQEKKRKPDINKSTEFPNVYHSPSANSTPKIFRSILNMEIVAKRGTEEAKVQYANGVILSNYGLVVSVVDAPGANQEENGGIESATVLMLDGSGVSAQLVKYVGEYGVAVFRVKGLKGSPLQLSKSSLAAGRRVSWRAIFKNGPKTYLYSRPLQIHKAAHSAGKVNDLCELIDTGSSSLNADRSGSPLLALDGSLVALMGRQAHWNVTPKNNPPRKKLAWAVPARVIANIVEPMIDQPAQ